MKNNPLGVSSNACEKNRLVSVTKANKKIQSFEHFSPLTSALSSTLKKY